MWEQNDRGGSPAAAIGTALVSNVKTNGPLFRQFGTAANVTEDGTVLSPSPGLNGVDTNPTREFPDMLQILANNTNAVSGTCPPGPPPPTALPPEVRECFSEFLPTADWVGFLGDRTMNFRLTARDGDRGRGRHRLREHQAHAGAGRRAVPGHLAGGARHPARRHGADGHLGRGGHRRAPVSTSDVKISLLSGEVLAAATPNDGSADVTVPNIADQHARIKVEAVGNVFFDVSDADLVIQAAPDVVVTDKTVQYSDAVSGTVVEATDADSAGSALTATATGLPAGLSLADGTTSEHSRTWTLAGNVTAAPGTYTGSVTVTDGDGEAITKPLIVTVTPEDAVVTYLGDTLSSGKVLLRARLKDADDGAPGDIGKATVTFKEGSQDALHRLAVLHGHAAPTGRTRSPWRRAATTPAPPQATVRVAKATKKVNAIGFLSHLSTIFAIDNRYAEIVYGKDGRAYRISADDMQSIGFSSDGKRAEVRVQGRPVGPHEDPAAGPRRPRPHAPGLTERERQGQHRLLALGRRHARPRSAREDAGRRVRHDTLNAMRRRVAPVDRVGVDERAAVLGKRSIKSESQQQAIRMAVSMVDLTTLEGADTAGKVAQLAAKAVCPAPTHPEIPSVAARVRVPVAGGRRQARARAARAWRWPAWPPASRRA